MGGTFSEPIPVQREEGYVAIVLRSYDKVRLIHAQQEVFESVQHIIR